MSARKFAEGFLKKDGLTLRSGKTTGTSAVQGRGQRFGNVPVRKLNLDEGQSTEEFVDAVSTQPDVPQAGTSTSIVVNATIPKTNPTQENTEDAANQVSVATVVGDGQHVNGQGLSTNGELVTPLDKDETIVAVLPETRELPDPMDIDTLLSRGVAEVGISETARAAPSRPLVEPLPSTSQVPQKRKAKPNFTPEELELIKGMIETARARTAGIIPGNAVSVTHAGEGTGNGDRTPSVSSGSEHSALTVPFSVPSASTRTPPLSVASMESFDDVPCRTMRRAMVSQPMIPNNLTSPPAPLIAPTPPANRIIDYWRAGGKLGDASVTPVDVVPIKTVAVEDYAQDIIRGVYAIQRGRQERSDVANNSVNINGVVALPHRRGDMPLTRVDTDYPRIYPEGIAPISTKIMWDNPTPNGVVDPVVVQSYLHNGQPDAKTAANVIKGKVNMNATFLTYAAPQLQEGMASYDLSGLFTGLFILIDYSIFLDKNGIRSGFFPGMADVISTCDVAAGAADIGASMVSATEAIATGRIPLQARDLVASDVQVMRALSNGPSYILVDEAERFIHKTITWQPIKWIIWESGPIVVPGAAALTTDQLFTFLHKLVLLLNAETDAVTGFIRAHSILNGRIVDNSNATRTWVTCSLEIERIYIPKPKGRNFLWNLLTSSYLMKWNNADFKEEYKCFLNFSYDEIILVGAIVASIYSLSVSAVFDNMNVSGKNLCEWAANDNVPVRNFLLNMFTARPNQGTIFLYSIACNIVPQFTGMKLSWLSFQTSRWCGGFTHRRTITQRAAWGNGWANNTPYMLRPEVLEWVIEKWLTIWGLSGASPSYDISNEMYQGGAEESQGFMCWMGDSKYLEASKCKNPFVKNPYSQTLITAVKQDWRNNESWVVSYRYIKPSSGVYVMMEPEYHTEAAWQPTYDANTYSIIAGTMPSWRWDLMVVMVPSILKRAMGVFFERLGHCLNVTQSGGGYAGRAKTSNSEVAYYGYDFTELFTGSGGGGAPALAAVPEAPAEVEN
ncbi:MAG: putative capsid protein [Joutseno totivirus]|nr:MAG: putative capsid protein [Joutseno totivirus]